MVILLMDFNEHLIISGMLLFNYVTDFFKIN